MSSPRPLARLSARMAALLGRPKRPPADPARAAALLARFQEATDELADLLQAELSARHRLACLRRDRAAAEADAARAVTRNEGAWAVTAARCAVSLADAERLHDAALAGWRGRVAEQRRHLAAFDRELAALLPGAGAETAARYRAARQRVSDVLTVAALAAERPAPCLPESAQAGRERRVADLLDRLVAKTRPGLAAAA